MLDLKIRNFQFGNLSEHQEVNKQSIEKGDQMLK